MERRRKSMQGFSALAHRCSLVCSKPSEQFMLRLLIAPLAEQVIVGIASGETAFFCSKFEGFLAVELGLADKFIHAIGERLGGVARDSGLTGKGRPNKKRDFAPYRFFFE